MQLAPPAALSSWLFKVHSPPKHPDLVHDHTQTLRHSDRCPLSAQSQRTWGLEENTRAAANEERRRRKDTGDWHPGFGKQRRRKATEKKRGNDGGRRGKRETCVGLFDGGASTKETSRGKIDRKSKRLSRDERKEGIAWERGQGDQTGRDEGRQYREVCPAPLLSHTRIRCLTMAQSERGSSFYLTKRKWKKHLCRQTTLPHTDERMYSRVQLLIGTKSFINLRRLCNCLLNKMSGYKVLLKN